jgi:hypothetical protein
MSKHPAKREQRALRKVQDDAVEVVRPAAGMPWFSFRYSYTEVSALGRTARLKSKHARYEDGKLSTETFEGEFDRSVYDRMVTDAQHFFLGQTALFLRALTSFLPLPGKQGRDRE